MTALLTADLHFNDKLSDSYRWGLLDWAVSESNIDEFIIAGDLSDHKDRHPSIYVNRMYNSIMAISKRFRVIILKGNHDYYDEDHPFFRFLGSGDEDRVLFIAQPRIVELSIGSATFVPAGTKWNFKPHQTDYLFTHATFSGAKAENGQSLTGVDPAVLDGFDGKVYSGDIHVPQKIGRNIEYIGAPYHTRFGDDFEPRLIWVANNGKQKNLYYPAPYKRTLSITQPDDLLESDLDVEAGDHVKVRCYLRRAEYVEWKKYSIRIREIAAEKKWLLFGVDPVTTEPARKLVADDDSDELTIVSVDEILSAYAKRHKASADHVRIGKELLRIE